MRVKVFAYIDPHNENLEPEEVVVSSPDFPTLDLNDMEVLDAVELIAEEYEDENNVTVDHGGDDVDYHLDLPDMFDTRDEAEAEANRLLAAMVRGLKNL